MRSFAFGCLVGCSVLWIQPALLPLTLCLLLSLAVLAGFVWLRDLKEWHPLIYFGLGCGLAIAWANIIAERQLAHRLPLLEQRIERDIEGYVCSVPRESERGVSFYFCPLNQLTPQIEFNDLRQVYLSWYFPEVEIEPMQSWRFKVRLKPIYAQFNPGSFDTERWALTSGIDATGYIKNGERTQANKSLRWFFESFRFNLVSSFQDLTQDKLYQGWHLALTTGERIALGESDRQLLKDSGTAHLIAISGLHVGLVFLWSYGVLSWLWRRSVTLCLWLPAEKVALLFSLMVACLFAFIAGFETPTQRALIALTLYVLSRFVLVRWSPFYLLSITLVILLLFDPLAVLSEGFWLSLVALATIFWNLPHLTGSKPFWAWLKLQGALSLGMAVFSSLLFGSLSLNALFANIVAIPAVTFIVLPLDLIAFASHGINSSFAILLVSITDHVINWLSVFLSELNAILAPVPLNRTLAIYGAVLMASIFLLTRLRHKLIVIVLFSNLVWLGLIVLIPWKSTPLDIYFLDVGQGLSVVIRLDDDWLVYDTGYADDSFSSVDAYLLPFLNQQGVSKLKYLVLSHSDLDHSGDWQSLVKRVPVEHIILGEPVNKRPANCNSRLNLRHAVELHWFQAEQSRAKGGNNASCLLRIQYGERSVLLTGDIERSAEKELLWNQTSDLQSEVMLVPHHGSKTSSSWSFLMQVDPDIAIVTNGYLNRFGHPHFDIVERYHKANIRLLQTSDSGMIHLTLDSNRQWQVIRYRQSSARFWNHAPERRNLDKSVVN